MADNYPHGLFTWADLASPDPEAATEFYSGLFGWESTAQTDPDGNYIYTMFTKDGKNVAGLGPQPEMMKGMPPIWNSYINVTNVDDVVAAATAAGGSVIVPAMDVMDSGRMAFLSDPTGALFGIWQAGNHRGADLFTEPGSMSWNELATRDLEAARNFYTAIMPWDFEMFAPSDTTSPPEYWVIKLPTKVDGDGDADDDFNGGVIKMDENWPEEIPAHWMVYFLVEDTEASAAKAAELGGNVSVPPFDTSAGKIAVLNDPNGGTFSIISAPSGP